MVEITAIVGASAGATVSLFANGIRKLPFSRYPYNHLAWAAAGWYLLPWWDNITEENKALALQKQKDRMEKCISY